MYLLYKWSKEYNDSQYDEGFHGQKVNDIFFYLVCEYL